MKYAEINIQISKNVHQLFVVMVEDLLVDHVRVVVRKIKEYSYQQQMELMEFV
jgi:hypothetical protein